MRQTTKRLHCLRHGQRAGLHVQQSRRRTATTETETSGVIPVVITSVLCRRVIGGTIARYVDLATAATATATYAQRPSRQFRVTTRPVQRAFSRREISCRPTVDHRHQAQPRRPGGDVAWRCVKPAAHRVRYVFHGTCPAYLSNIVEPVGAGRTRPRLYVPPRRRTSHCHGCAQSSANVHLATPVPLRGTTCLKMCAPSQTQRSSDSSWRLTFLLELLMFSYLRPSVFNVLSDSCNAPMFRL